MLSILTYLVKTLHFRLNGINLGFFCINYANFLTIEFFSENCIECMERN